MEDAAVAEAAEPPPVRPVEERSNRRGAGIRTQDRVHGFPSNVTEKPCGITG